MVRVIAKELGSRGITVNAIAPGPVETELFLRGKSQADIDRMVAMAPQKRLGQPSEIANLVAFLASPEAGWINGQLVRANGRSEERRVGKECVSTCRSRWSQDQ